MLYPHLKKTSLLFLILCFVFCQGYSQKKIPLLSNTQIIGGVYLHETSPSVGVVGQGNRYGYASPEIGIQHRFNNSPVSINYRRVWNYISKANDKIYFAQGILGSNYDEIDQFFVNYHLEKSKLNYRFGLGYFHKHLITPGYFLYHNLGVIFEYRGLALSTAFELENLSIEFKKYMALDNIAFFEAYLYAISVNKHFALRKDSHKGERPKPSSFLDNFHLYVSMRVQPIKYYHTYNADLFNFFGFAPGIGLSYFDSKHQLEFVLSRDSWRRYIGGTYENDLIGYISTSGIAIKKHLPLKNPECKLIFGLGWYPIKNDNEPQRIKTRMVTDALSGTEFPWPRIKQLNVFGIGITAAYQIDKNYSIEYRHIFPYLGDTTFSPWYGSLGISYHLF